MIHSSLILGSTKNLHQNTKSAPKKMPSFASRSRNILRLVFVTLDMSISKGTWSSAATKWALEDPTDGKTEEKSESFPVTERAWCSARVEGYCNSRCYLRKAGHNGTVKDFVTDLGFQLCPNFIFSQKELLNQDIKMLNWFIFESRVEVLSSY